MTKRWFAFMFALTALLIPFTASAQPPSASPAASAPPAETAAPAVPRPPGPVTLRTGAAFHGGSINGAELMRADVSAGVGFDVHPRVTLYADVHFGATRFAYTGAIVDGLSIRSDLWSYLDCSLSAGTVVHALRMPRFELDLFGEFEASFAHISPDMRTLGITTTQGSFDVAPYGRSNADVDYFWYRIALGPTFRMNFDWFRPSLTVGFEHIRATMDLGLTDDARTLVNQLGYDSSQIERPHDLSIFRVSLVPALGFRIGPRDELIVAGTVAPAPGTVMYGASTMFAHRF